jgi:protein phosphatase
MQHLIPPISLEIRMAHCTHRGCVRASNEDNALARPLPRGAFFGVCDGMGGEKGGEVASLMTVQALEEAASQSPPHTSEAAGRLLLSALGVASFRVHTLAKVRAPVDLSGMGTTASVAAIVGDRMVFGQVGDSRIYVLRAGTLHQITRDQSLAQLLVERGQLRPEDVESFALRNVILQAVGPQPTVDVDLRSVRLGRGDVVLVCSDGLYGAVRARELEAILRANPEPEAACQALVDAALAAEASDNVTCVVAAIASGVERASEPVLVEQVVLPV